MLLPSQREKPWAFPKEPCGYNSSCAPPKSLIRHTTRPMPSESRKRD